MSPESDVTARVAGWLAGFVVAENLCPFAGQAMRSGALDIQVLPGETAAVLQSLATEAAQLVEPGADPDATRLLALTDARFARLDDYLDLVEIADALLDELGLRGLVQLASFHPDYLFEGESPDDPSHWTNRSPVPLLHLLREEAVERALLRHPDPDAIPVRNIAHLRGLGLAEVRRRAQASAEGAAQVSAQASAQASAQDSARDFAQGAPQPGHSAPFSEPEA